MLYLMNGTVVEVVVVVVVVEVVAVVAVVGYYDQFNSNTGEVSERKTSALCCSFTMSQNNIK